MNGISIPVALAATTYTPDSVLSIPEGLLISVIGILVVMFELALLAIFILLMAKVFKIAGKFSKKKAENSGTTETVEPVKAPAGVPLPENNSMGKLDLIDVDEPTAAIIMAIVSNQSGIPLNRLSFKSIKKLEDK